MTHGVLSVPHAECVGDTLDLSGVDVLTFTTASVVGAPGAHGDGFAITLAIDACAVLAAHTRILVPETARIGVAIERVGVERRAGGEASVGDAIPAARLVVVASGFGGVDGARLRAGSGVGVPLTVRIGEAGCLIGVSGSAFVGAKSRSGVECAESGGLAIGGDESGARRSAGLVGVVPEASAVAHATRSSGVGVLAAFGALVLHGSGVVEAAHGVGSAGLGVGTNIRRGGEHVDGTARASAGVGGLVPHATLSAGAGRGVGELGGALHDACVADFEVAESAGGAFVGVGDDGATLVAVTGAGLVEASRVSQAVGLRSVLCALGLATTVVEFALSVGVASGLLSVVVLVWATTVAAVYTEVPAAHNGSGIAFGA